MTAGKQRMTPSEALVETLAAHGVYACVRHRRLRLHGCARPLSAGRHPLHPGRSRAGRRPYGGRLHPCHGPHGVCIAQNGPGMTNFVTGVAAAYWAHSPVVMITPETGSNDAGVSAGSRRPSSSRSFRRSRNTRAMCANQARMAELSSRCFDRALLETGPTQFNIPRDLFYGEFDATIPAADPGRTGSGGPEGS